MTIWKFSPGKGAHFWDACISQGLIAMGWEDVNDLTWLKDSTELSRRCKEVRYSWGTGRSADIQLWEFKNIQINDIIVAYGRGRILGLGIVISPYYYDNSRISRVSDYPYPHRHKVTWLTTPNRDIKGDRILYGDPPSSYGTLNTEDTIHEITDKYTIGKIKELVINALFAEA